MDISPWMTYTALAGAGMLAVGEVEGGGRPVYMPLQQDNATSSSSAPRGPALL